MTDDGIVCFSAQDWWYFNRAHSDFQLMVRMARERPVLFVNSITLRMPLPGRSSRFLMRLWRKARSMMKSLQRPLPDTPGFAVLTPVVVPFYSVAWVRTMNARFVALQVRLALRRLGMRRPVCLATIPTSYDVMRHFEHGPVVFNRSDRHSAFDEAHRGTIESLERALLREADAVLYVSHALMEDEQPVVGDRAVFLDHGVDVEHFAMATRDSMADDLDDVPRPIVGFFGGLDDYVVDMPLLAHVARELPDATLLLIGDATCSMRWVDEFPNVVWLGGRPYDDIPRYGAAFDVALMPWCNNEWIRYSNPIKMKEYLALGLPVVSTDFPEVRRYAEHIRIAATHQEFVEAIRATLADGGLSSPARRRAAVVDDTWDHRAAQLLALCEDAVRG